MVVILIWLLCFKTQTFLALPHVSALAYLFDIDL